MLMKSQFIFSQYFISNFYSISSQLYIKQLKILNLKTRIKKTFNINLLSEKKQKNFNNISKTKSNVQKQAVSAKYFTKFEKSHKGILGGMPNQKKLLMAGKWSIFNFIDRNKKFFSENKTNLYSFFYNPFLDFFNKDHFIQNFNSLRSFSNRENDHSVVPWELENSYQNNETDYNKEYELESADNLKLSADATGRAKDFKYFGRALENFANLNQQISQIHLTLTLEGIFKKNKILIEIKNKPNFLIQHKKNSFILPIPLSYKKGIVNKEIPLILSPIDSISNFIFPFLSKTQLWNSLYSEWFLKYTKVSSANFYQKE